jgi:type III pantothenate kinase
VILTIDVGNTDTVFDFYDGYNLVRSWRLPTKPYKDKLDFIEALQEIKTNVTGIMMACVVPKVRQELIDACAEVFAVKPLAIGDEDIRVDLDIKIDLPKTLGADRVANSIAAITKFGGKVIIVDFGTATTFSIIGDNKDYLGGAIMPGINSAIKGLHESAAMLPLYKIVKPKKVIATCLEDGLQSGIFYGTLGAVSFIIAKMKQELSDDYKVIATGGLGKFFAEYNEVIEFYDPHLTTFGLLQIYNFNK